MDDLIRRAREALVNVTPGPWDAALEHGCHGIVASIQEESRFVALIYNATETPEREPMRFANTRFIAAARDLVPAMADRIEAQEALLKEAMEALEALMEVTEPPERNCSCHINPPCGWCVEYEMVAIEHKLARATLAKLREHLGETE